LSPQLAETIKINKSKKLTKSWQKLSKGCQKISKSCQKMTKKNWQKVGKSCQKNVKNLSKNVKICQNQSNICPKICQKCFSKICQKFAILLRLSWEEEEEEEEDWWLLDQLATSSHLVKSMTNEYTESTAIL
jgi:hypothetical protein